MVENSLLINAVDPLGNKSQRTVTYTGAAAARDKMLTFAQGINALSTNNFVDAKHVQKVNLDDDPDGGYKPGGGYDVIGWLDYSMPSATDPEKTTPTITLSPTTITKADLTAALESNGYYDVTVTYDGDGKLYPYITFNERRAVGIDPSPIIVDDNGTKKMRIFGHLNKGSQSDVYVRSTATDTCNAASATFSITN